MKSLRFHLNFYFLGSTETVTIRKQLNLLPCGHLLGEEACRGREGPGHGPDAEDGEQHRHATRLGGQGLDNGLWRETQNEMCNKYLQDLTNTDTELKGKRNAYMIVPILSESELGVRPCTAQSLQKTICERTREMAGAAATH